MRLSKHKFSSIGWHVWWWKCICIVGQYSVHSVGYIANMVSYLWPWIVDSWWLVRVFQVHPLWLQHFSYYTPRNEVEGGYTGFTLFVRPSVRLSVCLSVRPSVRPWVGVRMITLILFSGFKFFFFTYITWVKILHGIEYQRPTSLNMRILADHVTYSFLAFLKSNFLVRAFQFGMTGVLSRIYDISPEFCWIPIFVFFHVFLN